MKTIIKTAIAPKISSTGALEYCIKRDKDNRLYIQIFKNMNGKGQFSKQDIPFSSIKHLLESKSSKSIFSKELDSLFKTKSSNNAGFLAAALRQEGILLEEDGYKHLIRVDVIAEWEGKTWGKQG
jgi:hypothetical protein